MLVLSRKRDQEILVGDVKVRVLKISGGTVKLGVVADRRVPVRRGELEPRKERAA